MYHTLFYLQVTPCLPLPRKRSPDGAFPDWGCGHLIAAYYSCIDLERMKGWVGLVGWPTADGLPTQMVTHQLEPEVERRTGKVHRSKTNVPPLRHATNLGLYKRWLLPRMTYRNILPRSKFFLPSLIVHNDSRLVSGIISDIHCSLFRKKHPLLFSCITSRKVTNLIENFRQNS